MLVRGAARKERRSCKGAAVQGTGVRCKKWAQGLGGAQTSPAG